MTDESGPQRETAGGASVASIGRRPSRGLWLKIVLFAAGVVVGVLAVGLLDTTTPEFAQGRAGGASGAGGASPSGGGAGVEARVNAACVAVINDAQDVYAVLTDLGPALDDTDFMALDDIVRRLQPVEPRLAADLQGCRIDTSVGGGTTSPGATPAGPTPAAPTPVVPTPVAPTQAGPTQAAPTQAGPASPAPTEVAPPGSAPPAPAPAPTTAPGQAPGVVLLR